MWLTIKKRARHWLLRWRIARWRWLTNVKPSIAYRFTQPTTTPPRHTLAELKRQGIVLGDPYFTTPLLPEVQQQAQHLFAAFEKDHKQSTQQSAEQALMDIEAKDFRKILTRDDMDIQSVFVQYALQPEFLATANAYLGMHAKLSTVQLWLNLPTPGEAQSTQLWHRDYDDTMNLKIFTYLNDVSLNQGPFTFMPMTHPLGQRATLGMELTQHRLNDATMRELIAPKHWLTAVGEKGTVVVADTCGYHKGLKPQTGHRLLLMCHYTSHAVNQGRMRLQGDVSTALSPFQQHALSAGQSYS